MEIKRNIPSQYSQTGRPKDDPFEGAQALKAGELNKATVEKQEKFKARVSPGISVDLERAATVSDIVNSPLKTGATFNINKAAADEETHDPMVRLQRAQKEEDLKKGLKSLENELKDYLKQSKVLIKENKTGDYKKMFEKMNSKLNDTIKIMEQDYPGQTKIIEHLKEWRTQITKQFMMAVPQQPQEVKQHTITIE